RCCTRPAIWSCCPTSAARRCTPTRPIRSPRRTRCACCRPCSATPCPASAATACLPTWTPGATPSAWAAPGPTSSTMPMRPGTGCASVAWSMPSAGCRRLSHLPHLPGDGPRSSLPAPHHALHPDPIVNHRHALLVLAIGASLALSACKREPTPASDDTAAATSAGAVPADETADAFVARVNAELKAMYPEMTAAQWLSSTYINDDSQLLAAKSNEKFLTALNTWI